MLTALFVAVVWAACFHYPFVWTVLGIGEADKLFLDLRNILSAGEVAQHGLNPYISNPLDPYNRLYWYSEWWLISGTLGLTLANTIWLGTLLIGLTLASAVWLLRPTDWWQGGVLFLFLASPPLLFAINRANNDLAVFVIMCAALACFRTDRAPFRALGVVLLAVSAVLKYFPLAAAVVLLEARTWRELLGLCLLYGTVLLLAWPSLEPGLRVALGHHSAPSWLYAFGAPVVFRDFSIAAPIGWLVAVFLALTTVANWPAVRVERNSPPVGEARARECEFACGAVMIVGCFIHGSSFIYKMVFALWMLPRFWRTTLVGREKLWQKTTYGLLLTVLWLEGSVAILLNVFASGLSPATAGSLLEADLIVSQIFTWAMVACLWRALLIYLSRQITRLSFPSP